MNNSEIAKKIIIASLAPLLIGAIFAVLEFAVPILLHLVLPDGIKDAYLIHIILITRIASAISFFVLFFWSGRRAVRKYRLDIPQAGLVGAISSGMIALFSTIIQLTMQFGLLAIIAELLSGIIEKAELETALLMGVGGVVMIGASLIATIFMGAATFFLTILLNFIVSALGGLFSTR